MMQGKRCPGSVYIIAIICLVFIFMGCSKQPVETLSVEKEMTAQRQSAAQKAEIRPTAEKPQADALEMTARRQPAAEKADVKPALEQPSAGGQDPADQSAAEKKIKPAARAANIRPLPDTYVVKKGDSLWWIAKYKDVYNDPYLWPVLYDANKKAIKDPNKIYPGMKLQIPRTGYKSADIRNARKTAGASKPYNPPARAVPPAD